jgi:hypothetical protein
MRSAFLQRRLPASGASSLTPPSPRTLTLSTALRQEACLSSLVGLGQAISTMDSADTFHLAHLHFLRPHTASVSPRPHHHYSMYVLGRDRHGY